VVLEWASRDPEAAVAGVGVEVPAIRRALVRGWYASGVPGLSEYVVGADPGRVGQSFLGFYAAELGADKGAGAIADWLDSIRGRGQRGIPEIVITNAHRQGIMAMATSDPDTAIAYCDLYCDGRYGDSMRSRLAERLGLLGEAERAVLWLEGAVDADQEERGRAARLAVRHWLFTDPDAAFAWGDEALGKYRDEPWFLPPAGQLISAYTARDPERALEWMDMFKDPEQREGALVKIARRWLTLDEKAAETWLETSSLAPEAQARARKPQKTRGGMPKRKSKSGPLP
jgi:hypothetical protein